MSLLQYIEQSLVVIKCLFANREYAGMSLLETSLLSGQFGEDFATKLQHICDSAVVIGSVSDDSDIHRIIPDNKR